MTKASKTAAEQYFEERAKNPRYAAELAYQHQELRSLLKVRIQRSITSSDAKGRTVEDPAKAAEYPVNALMEYPEGQDLIRRIARHLDAGGKGRMDSA